MESVCCAVYRRSILYIYIYIYRSYIYIYIVILYIYIYTHILYIYICIYFFIYRLPLTSAAWVFYTLERHDETCIAKVTSTCRRWLQEISKMLEPNSAA